MTAPNLTLLIIALVVIGYALIVIEIALVPGFGVIGILGFGAIIAASILLGYRVHPIWGVMLCLLTLLFSFLFVYYLPQTPFGKRLVLENRQPSGGGYAQEKEALYRDLINKTGVAKSTLRPAGIAIIDDRHVDVVTQGEFIDAGSRIRVVSVEGSKAVVEKID